VGRLTNELAGESAGWLAMLLLASTRRFVRMSASVMIGLPAMAVAVVGTLLLYQAMRRRSTIVALIAGVLLAVSMQIKLYTFILLPAVALGLMTWPLRREEATLPRQQWALAGAFLGGLVVTFAAIAWGAGATALDQLLVPHLGNSDPYVERLAVNGHTLLAQFGEDALFVVAALMGLVYGLRRRQPAALFAGTWLLTGLLVLLNASPVQSHHRFMVFAPLAMGGAAGLVELLCELRTAARRAIEAGVTLLVAMVVAMGVARAAMIGIGLYRWRGVADVSPAVIAALRSRAAETKWVFTDHPLIVWEAGLRSPPEVAVLTAKRLRRGTETEELVVCALQRYRPEQIVLARFEYPPAVYVYIASHYRLVLQTPKMQLLVRADLAPGDATVPQFTAPRRELAD